MASSATTTTPTTTTTTSTSSFTTTVLLIRHAEKLPWDSGLAPPKAVKAAYVDTHLLSCKGYERAQALVAYFQHRSEITALLDARPWGAVFAQDVDVDGGWGKSERPRETVDPLMRSPHMSQTPFILYKKSDAAYMMRQILAGKYAGRTVLVSWCHQMLPQLARDLGVPASDVPEWDKKRFDMTWVVDVTVANGEAKAALRQFPQRLLYGDSDATM
ncbi:hypothetical protein BDZ88DRAFT_445182 [Geranomyces variabilis]|nr:hypothetical protein BDZ88DRAFT_445182 [Geranomyces variabilis]KAJ3134329.1 hypothetical protein HDU90_005195 [Geranomyces variabilis]